MMSLNYLWYKCFKPFKSWKNKYLKGITKKEAKRLGLYEKVAQEISEYTGETVEVVRQKHKSGPEGEQNYGIFTGQNQSAAREKVEEFYRKCAYYVYELPLWNAECNRPKYLSLITMSYVRRNQYKKVMDFGAGAGDLCIELAANGLDVTYCDIGEQLRALAKWRFARRGLPVKIADGLKGIGNETYDCIFTFDALEHIKCLPEVLAELVSHIKIGGSLIFSGAFSGGTLHLVENEKYNDSAALDKLMRGLGLSFQDRFAQFYFYKKASRTV